MTRLGIMIRALAVVAILVLFTYPPEASAGWEEIDHILTQAYGAKAARECREYVRSLKIPEEHLDTLQESIGRLVEADYPKGCPREYLKLAAQLARAGISPADLTNKIREGIAKRVDADRLVHVLGKRAEALKEGQAVVLGLERENIRFLDRQMAYTVMADYLLRGVKSSDLTTSVIAGQMGKYPALRNVIH